jgi:hypothetical protein
MAWQGLFCIVSQKVNDEIKRKKANGHGFRFRGVPREATTCFCQGRDMID